MSCLIDVAIPSMHLNSLTYSYTHELPEGARVYVPIRDKLCAGFVVGAHQGEFPGNIKLKSIVRIIDTQRVVDADIWDMALWAGRVCLCGTAAALKAILPKSFQDGEGVQPSIITEYNKENFHETNFFNPFDTARDKFYVNELEGLKRTLVMMPSKERAEKFYENLPNELKSEAYLWPSHNSIWLWQAWRTIHEKLYRIVIAPPGGVFAPLMPEKIIVEDEASTNYILPYTFEISARSLAGRRASFLGAEFITGGRIPSLKTFMRTKPEQKFKPDRENIILADINYSRHEEAHGIDGAIPLTFSLIKRTYREFMQKNNVIWIMNRLGEASEVYCDNCGQSIKCSKCGNIMRSIDDGNTLKCRVCGHERILPRRCDNCGCEFFRGKRPGLDALAKILKRYYKDVHIYDRNTKRENYHGLILGTHKVIDLCDRINPGLVAWLDLDAELRRPEFNARYDIFSLLWSSYWRGREGNPNRKILIQSRRYGRKLAEFLLYGWEKFFVDELRIRSELMLPPCGYMVEVKPSSKRSRIKLINLLEKARIFVMDPGEEYLPFYISTKSLEPVINILESRFSIASHKRLHTNIIVRSE